MRKIAIGAFCAATLISSAAFAQTSSNPAPGNMPASGAAMSSSMASAANTWRVSKLVGVDIYNNANEKIGDINEILLDKTGKVSGVVIGVGGFLGMGEHDVLVNMSELKFVDEPMRSATAPATAPNVAANRTMDNATPNNNGALTNSGTVGNPAAQPAPAARANTTATRNWYPDHAILNATKDQLKAMPQFTYTDVR